MTASGHHDDTLTIDRRSASAVSNFVRQFGELNQSATYVIVLIGSVARGTPVAGSDLDLLILDHSTPKLPKLPKLQGHVHVHATTWDDFKHRLAKGDDFAAWSVRFGRPIVGASLWADVLKGVKGNVWPDWRQKVPHATRRLMLAAELRRLGDEDAAKEELLYALSHIARGLLLRERVFPLSRPELAGQVEELGYPQLAWLIESFISDGSIVMIREAELYARKLLRHLDKKAYEQLSIAFANVRRAKSKARTLGNGEG